MSPKKVKKTTDEPADPIKSEAPKSRSKLYRAGEIVPKSGVYNVFFDGQKDPLRTLCIKGERFVSARHPAKFSLSDPVEYQGCMAELHPVPLPRK
jgi:hypothetical protein